MSTIVKIFDEKFRENLEMLLAMSPEELEEFRKAREEEARIAQIANNLRQSREDLETAQWNLGRAVREAKKEGLL